MSVWPYLAVMVAAIVEGEVTYLGACALVAAGRLDPLPVLVAGAAGAAVGDQAYFYLFRKRLTRWMSRFSSLERRAAPLAALVRRRASMMVMLIRFAPGLRVAITAACAYVDVPPLKFSLLNGLTAVIWAGGLLALVAWIGPAGLERVGLGGWKGAVLMAAIIVGLFRLLGRFERKSMGE